LWIIRIIQLLFQSRVVSGLGRGVVRTGGKETRTNGDAQTNKGCDFHVMTIPARA
jgi:hypothetical protein